MHLLESTGFCHGTIIRSDCFGFKNFLNMQNATQRFQSNNGLTMNLEFRAWAVRVQMAGFRVFRFRFLVKGPHANYDISEATI